MTSIHVLRRRQQYEMKGLSARTLNTFIWYPKIAQNVYFGPGQMCDICLPHSFLDVASVRAVIAVLCDVMGRKARSWDRRWINNSDELCAAAHHPSVPTKLLTDHQAYYCSTIA